MATTVPALGLSPEERERYVERVLRGDAITADTTIADVTPAEATIRRLSWQPPAEPVWTNDGYYQPIN